MLNKALFALMSITSLVAFAEPDSGIERANEQTGLMGFSQNADEIANYHRSGSISVDLNHYYYQLEPGVERHSGYVSYESETQGKWVLVAKGASAPSKTPATDPNWGGFFGASKKDKDNILDNLLEGIGKVWAKKLVDGNYFNSKPKTWEAFKAVIQRADDDGMRGIYAKVIKNEGSKNKARLYGIEHRTKNDSKGVYVWVPDTITEYLIWETPTIVNQRHSDLYKRVSMNFDLVVRGSVLVNKESESFTLDFDGDNVSPRFTSNFNTFSITRNERVGDTQFIELTAKRNLVNTEARYVDVNPYIKGGTVKMMVTDKFPVQDERVGKLQVLYEIQHDDWGFGTVHKGYKTLDPALRGQSQEIDTVFAPSKSGTYRVIYRIKRFDSTLFNDSFNEYDSITTHKFEK